MEYENPSDILTISNPCEGDPSERDVLRGGFISPKAFLKPDSFYYMNNGIGLQRAGPRLHIAFRPEDVKACILSCGGICPGINVVIREIVMSLWFNYGAQVIYGVQWGYGGIYDESAWMELDPHKVKLIHSYGGTILGTSRGSFDGDKIINTFVEKGINMVFVIGGDGTHRGIQAMCKEIEKRKLPIVIAGIPKTIDNDIPIIDRSFGFESSVEQAVHAIQSANVEANSVKNGIGLVKLFGRSCGFIALKAALASRDVNICLIPESKFNLYGDYGLLNFLFKRLDVKCHCVIVVAEGAGSSILDKTVEETGKKDKSGNPILPDIGSILKDEIKRYADKRGIEIVMKYIDPTYIIRSCPPNSFDTNYCAILAQNAVHCAFSGFTNFTSGFVDNKPVMIPVDYLNSLGTRSIDTEMDLEYLSLLASTGQASFQK
jgi:6-phosphofructokinase 1